MTTTGPYSQSLNRTHMFSFVDYRGKSEIIDCPADNTLMSHINTHPQLTKFKKVVNRARMGAQLSQKEANFTLFAPLDQHLKQPDHYFDNMDDGTARQIVAASLMDRQIDGNLLKSSPVSYYHTKNSQMRMYVTNICDQTELNQCARVVKFDVPTNNGVIHLTDNIIVPSDATFIN